MGEKLSDQELVANDWPTRGPDFNQWYADAPTFLALVGRHPGFWCADYGVKYLNVRVDTRDGCHFILTDDQGERLPIRRVLDAIQKWRKWWPEAAGRQALSVEEGR